MKNLERDYSKPRDFGSNADLRRPMPPIFPRDHWDPICPIPGINLAAIANGTGLSKPGISRIFNGSRTPQLKNLESIKDFFSRTTGRKWTLDETLDVIRKKAWRKNRS